MSAIKSSRRGHAPRFRVCASGFHFRQRSSKASPTNSRKRRFGIQVGENPGGAYNPAVHIRRVWVWGKPTSCHAVGNAHRPISRPRSRVRLSPLPSASSADMVSALQHNTINEFKRFYRSVDALLIDDIQFFAGKERSQEEFFHTFNALLEDQQQVILTCDRYPKEVDGSGRASEVALRLGTDRRHRGRPSVETRAAILMSKATSPAATLPADVAFFIAQRIRSNVRELEGALRRVVASAHFTDRPISVELAREKRCVICIALQDKLVTIENIQKTVAQYYKVRVADLISKRRTRSIARPRQIAMALSKELTNHSLPEIGDAFGGRDHTTVLHACRKVAGAARGECGRSTRSTGSSCGRSAPDVAEDVHNSARTNTAPRSVHKCIHRSSGTPASSLIGAM